MGRPRKHHRNLPPRMYKKGLAFWYSGTKPWTNLGRDTYQAFKKYNELEGELKAKIAVTFADLSSQYLVRGMKDLKERTQRDYTQYIQRLSKAFGHMPLEDIEPADVEDYHEKRGETARVQANREKACLSLIWNWGRRKRLTKLPNPCLGVRRHRETGRKVLVDDALFFRVWSVADWDVRDALDLAYLTGQRPADVLKMDWNQVHGDEIWIETSKTGEHVRVQVEGELALVLNDIAARRGASGRLVSITTSAFDNRFEGARRAAGVELSAFQFRDLRAKAASEVADERGEEDAQTLLAHTSGKTTKTYIRRKGGKRTRSVR